jgi:hypothetical protein
VITDIVKYKVHFSDDGEIITIDTMRGTIIKIDSMRGEKIDEGRHCLEYEFPEGQFIVCDEDPFEGELILDELKEKGALIFD